MQNLEEIIKNSIKDKGPITFKHFMEMALYYPELGYYTRTDTEIGKEGDFYTSPHAHSLFGAMLGRQAEEVWEFMGKPERFDILEAGGGRGYLALDILDYLKDKKIYSSLNYTLIELNPHLKARQGELLKAHSQKLSWAETLKHVNPIRGIILSNELFDAMPVHLIEINDEIMEVHVEVKDDRLSETLLEPSSNEINEYLNKYANINELKKGYRTEVNLGMKPWLVDAAEALDEGFIITIDYGYPAEDYYAEDRSRGTLICYLKHDTNENFYENIGKQDMTAHVNFSAMKDWGQEVGLETMGFCRQGMYLVSLGIDELVADIHSKPDALKQMAQIKNLIMPGTMGDTHKVLLQYKGKGSPKLRGFKMKNQADKL